MHSLSCLCDKKQNILHFGWLRIFFPPVFKLTKLSYNRNNWIQIGISLHWEMIHFLSKFKVREEHSPHVSRLYAKIRWKKRHTWFPNSSFKMAAGLNPLWRTGGKGQRRQRIWETVCIVQRFEENRCQKQLFWQTRDNLHVFTWSVRAFTQSQTTIVIQLHQISQLWTHHEIKISLSCLIHWLCCSKIIGISERVLSSG